MRVNSFDAVPFVCSKENRGTAITHVRISDSRALNPSRWPDRHYDSFTPAEKREEAQYLLQGEVFLIQQSHGPRGLVPCHNLCVRVGPLAERHALQCTRSDFDAAIVANAFHFSRVSDRVDVEPRSITRKIGSWVGRKPYRRLHPFAGLFECFETDIFVIAKHRKSHGVAPDLSMHAILHAVQGERASSP